MSDMPDQHGRAAAPSISRRSLAAAPMILAMTATRPAVAAEAKNSDTRARMSADDRLDLIELISSYAWNYDCGNAVGTAATFTQGGIIEVPGVRSVQGRADIIRLIEEFYETARGEKAWQHLTSNHVFHGSGKDCVVYCYWTILETNADNKNYREKLYGVATFGYYRAECVQGDGGWLISKLGIHQWDRDKLPWAS